VNHEVVQLIGGTTTRAGWTVNAKPGEKHSPTNPRVSAEERASVNLEPSAFHGEWNYAISRLSHQNL
jgi:hypothetical protein